MRDAVYLDHNATTPLRPEAKAAMTRAMETTGNPSSVHGYGRAARRLVEDARERVAALAGVSPSRVVFTSGGSEANNAALSGFGARRNLVSAVEHASVLGAGGTVKTVPVDGDGIVDLGEFAKRLAAAGGDGIQVSVMAANNETGVVQPLREVAEIARALGATVHVDAIQAAGKVPLDEIAPLAFVMTLSGHKVGGPQGIGAVIMPAGETMTPIVRGGGQERRQRAGTENVVGIAGFGAAAEAALRDLADMARIAALRDCIEEALGDDATVYGKAAARLPNTTCIGMADVSAETQVMAFDLAGIAVSAGSACSSGKVEPSHVLLAMGVPEKDASEAVRVSLGWTSTEDDVETFIKEWRTLRSRAGTAAA